MRRLRPLSSTATAGLRSLEKMTDAKGGVRRGCMVGYKIAENVFAPAFGTGRSIESEAKMMHSAAVCFLLLGLAASFPAPAPSTPFKTPSWSSWRPEHGAWRSGSDGRPSDVPPEILTERIQVNYTRMLRRG